MSPPTTPSPSVLAGLKQALRPHAPFSAMQDADLDRIVRASRLTYFAPGESILAPTSGRPAHCFVIRQGTVRGEQPGGSGIGSALWGTKGLAAALRADIVRHAKANPRFLKQMSDNALTNRPPLNWRGELRGADNDSGVEGIDLKMSGSVPFVDAARIFALASGVPATNTVERLETAGAARGIPAAEISAWRDAFEYIQMLRLREQHRRAMRQHRATGDDNPNVVPLALLPELDRRILKEAMRQIRKVHQRLEVDYPG